MTAGQGKIRDFVKNKKIEKAMKMTISNSIRET